MEIKSAISLIGPAVGNHLWQSTVFAAAVWLVTLLLRRNAARVRFWLWLAASVKFLVPFSLLIAVGGLLPRPQMVTAVAPTAVYSAVDAVGQPFADFAATNDSAQSLSFMERIKVDLPVVLAVVWFCGALVVLTVWLVRGRQMHLMLRRAVRAGGGRELEILRGMSGGDRVELMLSRELMEPGIFGVFRPVLIWPMALSARLEDGHVEAIFAHELMHVERRDNLTAMMHMLVEALFWFHPLVWWMERRLVEERELACDEAVVDLGGSADTYAESLLKACRFCVEAPMVCVAGITGADLCKRVRAIMTVRLERLGVMRKLMLAGLMLAAVVGPVVFGSRHAEVQAAQAASEEVAAPEWEKAAGGAMEFEVASVRANPGAFHSPSFPLSSDDAYKQTGGLFEADFPVSVYIDFAYKLRQGEMQAAQLPKWVTDDNYEIHARAGVPNPTKDQMRLMMQALLKERFGLAVHFAMVETPVLEMTLAKPNVLGPTLHHHEDGPACPAVADAVPKPGAGGYAGMMKDGAAYPPICDAYMLTARPGGMVKLGSRDTTLQLMADSFTVGRLGRPVVDETGLTGKYDFTLEWTRQMPAPAAGGDAAANDPGGTTFLEAVREQLGMKLKPGKVPMRVLVVDHVERAAEN